MKITKECIFTSPIGQNGRMSNAMFQAAMVLGCATKYNCAWVLPEWEYAKYFPNYWPNCAHDLPYKDPYGGLIDARSTSHIYREPSFHYTPLIESEIVEFESKYAPVIDLHGYFQSEKYWEHCKEKVLKLFEFSNEIKERAGYVNELRERITKFYKKPATLISIHFRHGDYIGNPYYANLHETEYYENAISYFLKNYEACGFLVFSDDYERSSKRCVELEKKFHNTSLYPVYSSMKEADVIEMYMQSLCDHNITANSSYSWWSAYLNRNENKVVIQPKQWFNGEGLRNETKDLYIQNAILL